MGKHVLEIEIAPYCFLSYPLSVGISTTIYHSILFYNNEMNIPHSSEKEIANERATVITS